MTLGSDVEGGLILHSMSGLRRFRTLDLFLTALKSNYKKTEGYSFQTRFCRGLSKKYICKYAAAIFTGGELKHIRGGKLKRKNGYPRPSKSPRTNVWVWNPR